MLEELRFSRLNSDDAYKDLQPGDYISSRNMIPVSDSGGGSRRKNIKGTISLGLFPVSAQAVCNGGFYNRPTDKSYFTFDDPTNGDAIIEYDFQTASMTVVLKNANLNFSVNYPVTLRVANGLLYFNDFLNQPRKINIESAKAGLYNGTNFSEVAIAQNRRVPIREISVARGTDGASHVLNNPPIRRQSWQFALRFVYLDGEVTKLGPVSKVAACSRSEAQDATWNKIDLGFLIEKEVVPFLKRIELIARQGNGGNWFIYDKIDPSALTTLSAGYYSYSYQFYADRSGPVLPDDEALPLYESFPRLSSSMELFENRLFEIDSLEGFDLEEENWDASIQQTTIADTTSYVDQINPIPYFLFPASKYGAGLIFKMKDSGQTTPTIAKTGLSFLTLESTVTYDEPLALLRVKTTGQKASIQLTGTPPKDAISVQAVRTNNLSYLWWYGSKFLVKFPLSNEPTTLTDAPTGYFIEDGYQYFDMKYWSGQILSGAEYNFPIGNAAYMDIVVPDDMPFSIDDSILVQLLFDYPQMGGGNANFSVGVVKRFSNKIRIKLTANLDWRAIFKWTANIVGYGSGVNLSLAGGDGTYNNDEYFLHLLILRPQDQNADQIYYEIGQEILINNPGTDSRSFSSNTIDLGGDCYIQGYTYFEQGKPGHSNDVVPAGTDINTLDSRYRIAYPSMSPLIDKKGIIFKNAIQTDQGKASLEVDDFSEKNYGSVVRWSESYIFDSLLNGLGIMDSGNKYALPIERGDITKLVGTTGNVLLAIHARAMTSLYVNVHLLVNKQDSSIVSSDETIGDNRLVAGHYGTVNPESVVCVDDYRVYGFDLNASEPWRRSLDGVVPLATTYKSKNYFLNKSNTLKAAKAIDPTVNIRVIGGYDPYLEMFFLTFQEVSYTDGNGNTVFIPAETVGYSELTKSWFGNLDFTPEFYSYQGNNLLSVKNQKLWQHNADGNNHNQFYDVQYDSEMVTVCHPLDDTDNRFDNIAVYSNDLWELISAETESGQVTSMISSNFTPRDDFFYAEMLRDENTPSQLLPPGRSPRLHGNRLIGQTLKMTLRNSSKKEVILNAVYLGYTPIKGHLTSRT